MTETTRTAPLAGQAAAATGTTTTGTATAGDTAAARTATAPLGQVVAQAEAVLSQLLSRALAETGTSRQDYLALQRLTALGGAATRDAYIADLSEWLRIDLWSAGELADSLAAAGLVGSRDGTVGFAQGGTELRDQVARSAGAVTRSILAPLDPADLEATIRTLRQVTARGRALLAAGRDEAERDEAA